MKIAERLAQGRPTFSFEFFPPKTAEGFDALFQTIADLQPLHPDYVSVTYGAGGSTRARTVELTARIKHGNSIEPLAHLTCVGSTREEIAGILDEHERNGVENILALRGDPPDGRRVFEPTPGGFAYANDLVDFIHRRAGSFCIGVAGYPEGHPECLNITRDLENLKRKVDAGASFVVTQLFFDNADFLRFRDRAVAMGIHAPIVAGIMPILNVKQIKRFISMCGSKIPHGLLVAMESVESDPAAVHCMGVDHATHQCEELLRQGVAGIHFYTLNKSRATLEILKNLQGNGAR